MQQIFIASSLVVIASMLLVYLSALFLPSLKRSKSLSRQLLFTSFYWLAFYLIFAVFSISNQLLQMLLVLFLAYRLRQEIINNLVGKYWFEITAFVMTVLLGLVSYWSLSSMSTVESLALFLVAYYSDIALAIWHHFKKKTSIYMDFAVVLLVSLIGFIIVNSLVSHLSVWLAIPVAIGIALANKLNTTIKKALKIHNWGNTLQTKGGFIDLLAGLGFASIILVVSMYF